MELPSNSQISSQPSLKTISSWIRLEEVKLGQRGSIPRRVLFDLNADLLQQISQIKHLQQSLPLPPALINQLRYYALLNSPLEQARVINYHFAGKRGYRSRCGLTFDTDYFDAARGCSLTLLRSAIDSEGKIAQQVHQDLLHNPQLLEQLTTVHYWLIAEIMAQLPCQRRYFYSWLVLISLLTVASIVILIINHYFSLSLFVNLVILAVIVRIFQTQLTSKLITWLKFQLIYHLVDGLLVKDRKMRQIAARILMFIS